MLIMFWTEFDKIFFAINQVTSQVLQFLYQAYIIPVIDYCDIVWTPSNSSDIRHLHSKFTSSTAADNFYLQLSALTEGRVFQTALQVFKIVNRISLLTYMTFFLLLWMSLAVLAGTNIDYLFLELILILKKNLLKSTILLSCPSSWLFLLSEEHFTIVLLFDNTSHHCGTWRQFR